MKQNYRENRRDYFNDIASLYVGNGIWQSLNKFQNFISEKENEKIDYRNFNVELLDIEFLDDKGGNAKYGKLFELSKQFLNKDTIYYYKDFYKLCEDTNFNINKEQAKIRGQYIEKMLIDDGYGILQWDEYISLVKKTALDNFKTVSDKHTFDFFGHRIFDGRLVEDECIKMYGFSKHFIPYYKTELKPLIYENDSSIIFGGKRDDSLRMREIATNSIIKDSYEEFKIELKPILEKYNFLTPAFSDRSTKGFYNQKHKLTYSFEIKVPNGLSTKERMDLIKKDMEQKDKKGNRKYVFFKDFSKDYAHHMIWLSKYFKPKESTENRKKYDLFFSSLIRTKTEKSYNDILKLSLTKHSFLIFKEDCPVEYDYCSRNKRNWVTQLRIDCETIKPGWDNGKKKPKIK
jgi:hypothetical protein